MRKAWTFLAIAASLSAAVVDDVSAASKAGRFAEANSLLRAYKSSHGVDPDYLAGLSWIGRGYLFAKQYDAALANAKSVYAQSLSMLRTRKLDAEPSLPTALGASIEVTGQSLAGLQRRDEAVVYLKAELEKWKATSIAARISKNLNLLSLEGKPAPELEIVSSVTATKARPISAHAGHPVLLFFWAHWCSDCKAEIPLIVRLRKETKVDIIAPTQHYGYVAGGDDAKPAVETPYIASVFRQYFSGLGEVETPLSESNFVRYGVSTTPTLALLNAKGIVTTYHPGAMTWDELTAAVSAAKK